MGQAILFVLVVIGMIIASIFKAISKSIRKSNSKKEIISYLNTLKDDVPPVSKTKIESVVFKKLNIESSGNWGLIEECLTELKNQKLIYYKSSKAETMEHMKKRKKYLLSKYGKDGGLEIFSLKITEKKFTERKALIEKYGKAGGLEIFSGKITEKGYLKREDLKKKYGNKNGNIIFEAGKEDYISEKLKFLKNNMPKSIVNEILGKPKRNILKKGNKWYLGADRILTLLSFDKKNILSSNQKLDTIVEMGMTV